MTLDPTDLPERCANCGKPVEEWTEHEGRGVVSGGIVYCSDRCALQEAAEQHID